MSSPEQRIQVLYEISLSVGIGTDLTETARTALSTYLQKLNCSAGAVFERCETNGGGGSYETVAMIPSRAAVSEGFEAAMSRLPDDASEGAFRETLPIAGQHGDEHYYLMDLPDFGILLLVVRGRTLDSETVAALGPLNEKLATACRGKRFETRLREERDRFEAVFKTIEEPLASVRPANDALLIQRINPAFAATFGYDETDAVGRDLRTLLGPGPSEDANPIPSLTGPDGQTVSVRTELRRETTDGVGEFLFRSAPIDATADDTEHLVLFVDVTEEAQRQRRLERLHEVTTVLSRILRHNIRNDLTVIQSMAERIQAKGTETVAEDAQTILRKSNQLSSTADNAREMRNLVATRDPQPPISLETAITDAVAMVRSEFTDPDIVVEDLVGDDVTVHPSLTIAIRHLIENGIKHYQRPQDDRSGNMTDGDPRVRVSTRRTDGGLVVEISDNGPGIPDAEVAMLHRDGETVLQHGSGAGLWIVNKVADYCDATLAFSVDDGTTATLTLDI